MTDMHKDKPVDNGSNNIEEIIGSGVNKLIKELAGKGEKGRKRVIDNKIAFIGGAGGCGTSTIVANVARAIAKKGLSVIVIDANITDPVQQNYSKQKIELDQKDLMSYLTGLNKLGDSIKYDGKVAVLYSRNRSIKDEVLLDSSAISNTYADMINSLAHLFDVVLIDVPRNISHEMAHTSLYTADSIYYVWNENIECVNSYDRYRINMSQLGIDFAKVRVLINQRTDIHYPTSIFASLNIDPFDMMPFDTAIIETGLRGEIFIEKGSSMSKNATLWIDALNRVTDHILKNGGYADGQ